MIAAMVPPREDPTPSDELDQSLTQRLAKGAQRGEPGSFDELYGRLAPALFAWASLRARSALGGRVAAEDLVQEAWYRAHRAFPQFDAARVPFRRWLFRIAKNVLLEAIRKVPSLPLGPGAAGESTRVRLFDRPDEATSVTRRLARDEAVRDFQSYLKELPAEDQDLVLHLGIEGLTNAEAARRLGISTDAATKRWQRLRAHLRASRAAARLLED